MTNYVLDGKNPVAEPDVLKWARWYETAERQVASEKKDGVRVSTVFLGIDHNFHGVGEPILFETMVFGGEYDGHQERYCTWEEAEAGHAGAVEMVWGKR